MTCDKNGRDKQRDNEKEFKNNPRWEALKSWKSQLNNLHLLIEPWNYLSSLVSWLKAFNIPEISIGLSQLIQRLNLYRGPTLSIQI
jgi:hypothetical protein